MRRIYMDHSATTPVAPEVLDAMLPYFREKYGNASSLHEFGREARDAVESAREELASLIGASPEEIYFTSGGTESDNLALKGVALSSKGKHIITTSIEHPAVLEVCRSLERMGFDVTCVPVDDQGIVNPGEIERAIRDDTVLISVMHANNEIGTIQPIKEIAEIASERDILLHTDAVQTVGKIPVNVDQLGVDLLSISAHKFYGPKGVGALYVRKGTRIESIIQGGGHERGLRSGTENVPGIVGMGRAAELASEMMDREAERLTALRERLKSFVLSNIDDSWLNGHPTKRLPINLNFGFGRVEGESLLLYLDSKGIAVSTGSACSSKKLEPSHVLRAIGLDPVRCHGSLRITLGRDNTQEDVDYVGECIREAVERFRGISALR
ncbi:cysteine desulfurase NifS [Methanothrix thermoacetophila]|uniref:Cysteine desulfurase IscS n=1 Tax=Methanothrix thermoacetophila (strain DSM 6194 / JCM 14653 / NBRC 101360 / PT) TaxID=349307 RepID=A0B7I6_METTP|nr:cysteine desulfurase NifS [Methanothrix thermoacetophila]ABK14660.1 aminotransferase, class V [Methanothrix thermoacetophila PT]